MEEKGEVKKCHKSLINKVLMRSEGIKRSSNGYRNGEKQKKTDDVFFVKEGKIEARPKKKEVEARDLTFLSVCLFVFFVCMSL